MKAQSQCATAAGDRARGQEKGGREPALGRPRQTASDPASPGFCGAGVERRTPLSKAKLVKDGAAPHLPASPSPAKRPEGIQSPPRPPRPSVGCKQPLPRQTLLGLRRVTSWFCASVSPAIVRSLLLLEPRGRLICHPVRGVRDEEVGSGHSEHPRPQHHARTLTSEHLGQRKPSPRTDGSQGEVQGAFQSAGQPRAPTPALLAQPNSSPSTVGMGTMDLSERPGLKTQNHQG